jgi:hypothetical protein
MEWGYSEISLALWLLLPIYGAILFSVFVAIQKGRSKHRVFRAGAIFLVLFHVVAILSLAINDSAASVKSVGFEAWACGRQIQPAESSSIGRIFRDGASFLEDEQVFINSSKESILASDIFDGTGIKFSADAVSLELSKEFELKLGSDSGLAWLKDSLTYESGSANPTLSIANTKLKCPDSSSGEWNVFVASVNSKENNYSWKKVSLEQLPKLELSAKDGNDLPDCLILDYGASKTSPEYRCGYLLKNDSERCPAKLKENCKLEEVSGQEVGL